MPYCNDCGAEVLKEMLFCEKCGEPKESLSNTSDITGQKDEKPEKIENSEKREKWKYHWRGNLIAGIILIIIGSMLFFEFSGAISAEVDGSFFWIAAGIIIGIFVLYEITKAKKRHPPT